MLAVLKRDVVHRRVCMCVVYVCYTYTPVYNGITSNARRASLEPVQAESSSGLTEDKKTITQKKTSKQVL